MTGPAGTKLDSLNTFRVAATAAAVQPLTSLTALPGLRFDPARDIVLGGGSNVLLADDVPGTVWLNRLPGREVTGETGDRVLVRVGAGENWHDVVRWTLDQGLSGLENLSLIPGLAGAAPIQNIGAYGVELAEHLHEVETWDWTRGQTRIFPRDACGFAYRDSRFKSGEPDRFLVTALVLALDRTFRPRLAYAGLREQLDEAGVDRPTARDVSDAVIALRERKLPNPREIGNAGSFFKNPVVDSETADRLRRSWPELPLHEAGEGRWKASAAWMIEHCGWKGRRDGDAGVSARHALVLVNHGAASGAAIAALAARVQADVMERFGIALDNEPRIIRFQHPENA